MQAKYYKPSGRISPVFLLLFFVFMLIAIPVLSVAYIYAIYYIPIIYVSVLIAIACGALLGVLIMFSAKWGKNRNKVVVVLLTILAVVLLKYTQWCVYIPLVYSEIYHDYFATFTERLFLSLDYFISPTQVLAGALDINEYGVWSVGSSDVVTGVPLLVVWVLEFLVFLVCAVVAASFTDTTPFSEKSNAWYKESKDEIVAGAPANPDTFKAGLAAGDFRELVHLVQQGVIDEPHYLGISVFDPPPSKYVQPYYLTITDITIGYDKSGKANYKRKPLFTHIAVDPSTAAALRQPPV